MNEKTTCIVFIFLLSLWTMINPINVEASSCSEELAIAEAKISLKKYCGRHHGCHFIVRKRDTDSDPKRLWLVTASLIHSFDGNGKPRFMPEGAVFLSVSKACKATYVRSHGGEKTIEQWHQSE